MLNIHNGTVFKLKRKGGKTMIGKKIFLKGVVAAVVVAFLATAPTIVFAKTYNMTGKISAIDLSYQTVVIQCPLASHQIFTVGGPLAAGAKLTINNKQASLNDFKVGERVAVRWHSTPQGHVIDRLVAK
jgi:hypothetical protein